MACQPLSLGFLTSGVWTVTFCGLSPEYGPLLQQPQEVNSGRVSPSSARALSHSRASPLGGDPLLLLGTHSSLLSCI